MSSDTPYDVDPSRITAGAIHQSRLNQFESQAKPDIFEALARLDQASEELNERLSHLFSQLEPVLSPGEARLQLKDDSTMPNAGAVYCRLEQRIQYLLQMKVGVNQIIGRLEF